MNLSVQRVTSALPGGRALKRALHNNVMACGVSYWHFSRSQQAAFTMMTYHRLMAEPDPFYPDALPVSAFETQMRFFSRFCRVMPLGEIVSRLETGKPLPRRCVTLTFDDGFLDTYTLAFPLLRQYRLPATVYVTTQALDGTTLWPDRLRHAMRTTRATRMTLKSGAGRPVTRDVSTLAARLRALAFLERRLTRVPDQERLATVASVIKQALGCTPQDVRVPGLMMTWDHAREMAASHITIGAHTVSHAVLTKVSRAQAAKEIGLSKKMLEARLQRPVEHFAYPHGAPWCVSRSVRDEVAKAGFRSACTTFPGLNTPETDRMLLKRVDGRQASLRSFVRYITGQ